MRLLNIHTLKFREFGDDDVPPYLVSSHRWSDDEASYKDVLKQRNTLSQGFKKIHQFCIFAGQQFKKNAFSPTIRDWIWIDTCCINKNSSAEVSESINSMRTWYTKADHCIAYLKDVRPFSAGWDAVYYDFRRSEWFQRGWTLQELLAPTCVVFLTRDWEPIGRKSSRDHTCVVTQNILNRTIQEITHIPEHVLYDFGKCSTISSESKMAWAANRRTTKSEDMAYCLLGIFDVHMPLIYGEGARNARKRLEEEIRKREAESQASQALSMQMATLQHGPSGEMLAIDSQTSQAGINNPAFIHSQGAQRPNNHEEVLIDSAREETIDETDLCPVCQRLLYSPVMTACNHTICKSCMARNADISFEDPNMTIVSLDEKAHHLDSVLDVEARCPVCGTQATTAAHDWLASELSQRYPDTYAKRKIENFESDEKIQAITLFIGNEHRVVGENDRELHQWMFFVRPSRSRMIREVHMRLHPSFSDNHIICRSPPYSILRVGWGYFTIPVDIVLRPGYSWISSDAKDAPDGRPKASLTLTWTLDFDRFDGQGSMGMFKLKVKSPRSGVPGTPSEEIGDQMEV